MQREVWSTEKSPVWKHSLLLMHRDCWQKGQLIQMLVVPGSSQECRISCEWYCQAMKLPTEVFLNTIVIFKAAHGYNSQANQLISSKVILRQKAYTICISWINCWYQSKALRFEWWILDQVDNLQSFQQGKMFKLILQYLKLRNIRLNQSKSVVKPLKSSSYSIQYGLV